MPKCSNSPIASVRVSVPARAPPLLPGEHLLLDAVRGPVPPHPPGGDLRCRVQTTSVLRGSRLGLAGALRHTLRHFPEFGRRSDAAVSEIILIDLLSYVPSRAK